MQQSCNFLGVSIFSVYEIRHEDRSQQIFDFKVKQKTILWYFVVPNLCTKKILVVHAYYLSSRIILPSICSFIALCLYTHYDANYLWICYFVTQHTYSFLMLPWILLLVLHFLHFAPLTKSTRSKVSQFYAPSIHRKLSFPTWQVHSHQALSAMIPTW